MAMWKYPSQSLILRVVTHLSMAKFTKFEKILFPFLSNAAWKSASTNRVKFSFLTTLPINDAVGLFTIQFWYEADILLKLLRKTVRNF